MNNDRLKHSISVARKMVEIGKDLNLNENKLKELFVLGYNHDIGYEFCEDKINHNVIGGELLKSNNYLFWKEVYYHGNPETNYKSLYLDILNKADMQIDKYGNDVGYNKRLDDIKERYGIDSIQYINSKTIIENIQGGSKQ